MSIQWQTRAMERGVLSIYLGAAPGVGKTYAMLGEARRRRERGADVVIGLVETHGRSETADQIGDLEVLPRRRVEHRGVTLSELDVDAVIARHPDVVLVDEYAHTNAPGSAFPKRWQDVERIVDAGIDVLTTLNIQHLDSINDVVAEITGTQQTETVPDRVVRAADQIELVDMSPEALRRRMAHGKVYPPDRADAALSNFFRPGNLGALRELALLWLADRVEEHLDEYLAGHHLGTWETRERVVVGVTAAPGGDNLIRRAARISGRVGGELIGVHVATADGRVGRTDDGLVERFALLESLGGVRREVVGDDPVASLVEVARNEHATQIVIGATRSSRWSQIWGGSVPTRLSRIADDIDLHIVAYGVDDTLSSTAPPPRRIVGRGRVRAWRAAALLAIGLPALTACLLAVREHVELSTVLLAFLGLVVVVAFTGGRLMAALGAVAAALTANFFFVEPRHTLTIADVDDVVALVVFTAVGLAVGTLVDRAAAQTEEATRARNEAAILARSSAFLAADPDPVGRLMASLLDTFGLTGARLSQTDPSDPDDQIVAAAGDLLGPESVLEVGTSLTGARRLLSVAGRTLTADDRRVLTALGAQLGVALDRVALRVDAQRAEELAAVDETRTSLLRAVSHDLRTPLATITALASGLTDRSVAWQPDQLAEMHATIDEEANRLSRLIANLLDASRLETGALAVNLEPVEVQDVIDSALWSISRRPTNLEVHVPPCLPPALADRSLLERAIANLAENAIRYSPAEEPIVMTVAPIGAELHVCVIDRGPGIPVGRRAAVLAPFQRSDDTATTDGVGLGLSIVDGFVRAMHGRLELDDTPGGGLTAIIALPAAEGGASE